MGSNFVDTAQPFKVLVLGGSYAGLSAALNLHDLCQNRNPRCGNKSESDSSGGQTTTAEITIVDERDGFYHLIGSPLALASESYAKTTWVRFEEIPALQIPNIRVIQGSVRGLDSCTKTATIATNAGAEDLHLKYDYLVAATGLKRAWPVVPQSLRRNQYLSEIGEHVSNIQAAKHGVVVVGGGAVGIEMAAELKLVQPHMEITLVHSRDRLLSAEPLPDETKARALELLREANVDVLMSHRLDTVKAVKTDDRSKCLQLLFSNGNSMRASEVITAVSKSTPATFFLPQAALNAKGYVEVNPNLSFMGDIPNASHHFAAGDIAQWSGIKRCGAAMHMGYVAAVNIHQLIKQAQSGSVPEFVILDEIPPMIGLAVGKNAVAYWPGGGTTSGEDVMETYFGNDLGFTICWNWLQLGNKQ